MKTNRVSLLLFLVCLCFSVMAPAQEVTLDWAKQFGGARNVIVNNLALDKTGNVALTGNFEETVDFDPGPGTYNLTSGGGTDIFIAKLDSKGEFLWAKHFPGTENNRGFSVTTDATGNIYATGIFFKTIDFDPGPGIASMTATSNNSIFIIKLDTDGNLIWVKQFGATEGSRHQGKSIAIDSAGDVLIAGSFNGQADFDPGPGTFSLISTSVSSSFICKLSAEGDFRWVSHFGVTGDAIINDIEVDASDNVLATGYFQETADFDPGAGNFPLTSIGKGDIFILKISSTGSLGWAKSVGSVKSDAGNSIVMDLSGSVYTTGFFNGTADFDPGSGVFNLTSGYDNIFISKLSSAGEFQWAKMFSGSNKGYGRSIDVDLQGRIYITGAFKETVDFDPGPAVNSLISKGEDDVFICKLDTDGNFIRVNQLAGSANELATTIVIDPNGTIVTAGYFAGATNFDPGSSTNTLTAKGIADAFIVKLSQETSGLADNRLAVNCVAFPNPTVGPVTINAEGVSGQVSIRVYSMHGILIREIRHPGGNRIDLDLTEEPNGLYVVEISDFKTLSRLKVLKY